MSEEAEARRWSLVGDPTACRGELTRCNRGVYFIKGGCRLLEIFMRSSHSFHYFQKAEPVSPLGEGSLIWASILMRSSEILCEYDCVHNATASPGLPNEVPAALSTFISMIGSWGNITKTSL